MMEKSHDGLLIYVKNDEQRDDLQRKYPTVNAEFITMKRGDTMADVLPMVCMTKDGQERCEIGEQFIEIFSKEMD